MPLKCSHFRYILHDYANPPYGLSDEEYPDEKHRRLFMSEYLKEWKKLNADLYDESIDNLERLTEEVELLTPMSDVMEILFHVFWAHSNITELNWV